ncbi:protein phosphatase 1 regulatory subunit 14D [Tachyglossus aculeatus]|uniref:protein phosphatase 1 regulatory subunit 14D n=1 Tax=Tachyglossus aculeatus TaxID=9261 RepID=UPI0018F2F417|nr:protein phosphatase 1 regulatory subunit 14D [Tachyglossus aculeatus]
MLSSSSASCPAGVSQGGGGSARGPEGAKKGARRPVTFQAQPEAPEPPPHVKRPARRRNSQVTVRYDRGQLQRWLEVEEWVDARLRELYQEMPDDSEPEIDLEALMELPREEQKVRLQGLLSNCSRPTEEFISGLLSHLKKLRPLNQPQKYSDA